MYHKMDKQYNIICINEVVEVGEYKEDGYTNNILLTFKSSPKGYYQYFKEIIQMGLKDVILKKKIYVIKHFIWFSVIRKLVK